MPHTASPSLRRPPGRPARPRPAALLSALLLAWACGEAPPEPASPAGSAEPAATGDLSGVYEAYGTTVDRENGDTRQLFGTLVLQQDGASYTASFELKTEYPVEGGAIAADVIGDGAGTIAGARLEGRSHTQLVLATVPGVDTGFAFLPRRVGPRIESRTVGTLLGDGTLELVSENAAAAEGGQGYRPTRTTLRATRVDDAAKADAAVGAGPSAVD
jgi:hypothetical protein